MYLQVLTIYPLFVPTKLSQSKWVKSDQLRYCRFTGVPGLPRHCSCKPKQANYHGCISSEHENIKNLICMDVCIQVDKISFISEAKIDKVVLGRQLSPTHFSLISFQWWARSPTSIWQRHSRHALIGYNYARMRRQDWRVPIGAAVL